MHMYACVCICAHMFAYGVIRKQMCAEEAPADAAPDGQGIQGSGGGGGGGVSFGNPKDPISDRAAIPER
jgi:hypothetical protein